MSYVTITLETSLKQQVDLALPLTVSNQLLSMSLVQALNLLESTKGNYLLSIKNENGIIRLPVDTTLAEAGVLDGFVLQLQPWDIKAAPRTEVEAKTYLQSESGETFHLRAGQAVIGRKDVKRGVMVEIDIAPYDTGKVISRRHAAIEKKGKVFFVTDLGSTNGTKVNGKKLAPREKQALKNGDILEFGRDGVKLRFVEKS
jgi:hypothetical protein